MYWPRSDLLMENSFCKHSHLKPQHLLFQRGLKVTLLLHLTSMLISGHLYLLNQNLRTSSGLGFDNLEVRSLTFEPRVFNGTSPGNEQSVK